MYAEHGTGDVAFIGSSGTSNCSGFWLRPCDPGFKTLYAALMTAYVTKLPISVTAYDDQIWSGSATTFCRVYGLYPQ